MVVIQGLCGKGHIPRRARKGELSMPQERWEKARIAKGSHHHLEGNGAAASNCAAASMLKTEPKGLAPNKSSNQWITRPVLGLVS